MAKTKHYLSTNLIIKKNKIKKLNILKNSIVLFIDNQFDRIHNTQRALQMIKRFEKLDLPNLGIQDKYVRILSHYGKDIETVSKIYQKSRQQPPIARDLPPIAGKILWVRQLYRRISHPMSVFESNKTILQLPEAKKIIKNYNQLSAVLVEYEVLFHRTWLRQIELIITGIHASLLVKEPEANEYFVNFDPEIMTLIRETECMKRLDLDIPQEAEHLVVRQEVFKQHYDRLKFLIDENNRIRNSIPSSFEHLMAPRLAKLDQVFGPGCISMTWVSPNIDEFCDHVEQALHNFDLILSRANDLVAYRIEAILTDMSNTPLCEIPDEEPISIEEFVHRTEELCEIGAAALQTKSHNIEEATEELIELLYPDYKTQLEKVLDQDDNEEHDEAVKNSNSGRLEGSIKSASKANLAMRRKRDAWQSMQEAAFELFNYFNHRNLDAIIKLVRSTLERLRKRISASHFSVTYNESKEKQKREIPVYKSYAVLAIPTITMQPSLDEIQQSLNKCVQTIINVSKNISQWSKGKKQAEQFNIKVSKEIEHGENSESDEQLTSLHLQKNYHKSVLENKEVAKMISLLFTCISSNKKEVSTALEKFKGYQFIWEKEREQDIKEFLVMEPKVSEFENKIKSFERLIGEINAYDEYVSVGPIALLTEKLKLGLTNEIQLWKTSYGQACNQRYKKEINEIMVFIEDVVKKLQREIKDLDDIRSAMAALKDLRENEIRIDMIIMPIEESYAMLQKHEIQVAREEIEKCDTLRYSWQKLLQMASQTSGNLLEIQPLYKESLKNNVKEFVKDVSNYAFDYKKNGPMVPGVAPREASDRLFIFQNQFDTLQRKFTTYSGGEELFGLPVTEYPDLVQIRKELNLLQKLYGLYNNVIDTVNGYYEILWTDVNIDKIVTELTEFQNK